MRWLRQFAMYTAIEWIGLQGRKFNLAMITSTSNARVKSIRKLRDRKERDQSGSFYIEGLRIVGEAVEQGAKLEELIVSPELLTSDFGNELLNRCRQMDISILEVDERVFDSFSLKDGPQGIAAVVQQAWQPLESLIPGEKELWIALDSIQDPGNLGTILRTSDAVGSSGLILLDQSTDPYSPSAIRASMGAIFSQKIVKADAEEFSAWKKSTGCTVVGTSDAAQLDYQAYRYPERMVLLMGSERQGLHEPYFEVCDALVSIPMVGKSDSLNLAVATGITLYEIFNQHRSNPTR